MQATSTEERMEERTEERTGNLITPNNKQKVTKDAIYVDIPDLPEAN